MVRNVQSTQTSSSKWLKLSLFVALTSWECTAMAVPSSPGLDLTIFLEAGGHWGTDKIPHYQAKWGEACENFKAVLENPNGRFGHGPFTKVKCLAAPSTLGNLDKGGPKPSWAMRVVDSDKQSGAEIYYLGAGTPRIEASQLGSASDKFLDGLTHKKVVAPLALLLMDRLPMFTLVSIADDDARQIDVESPLLPDPMPDEFVVYSLQFDVDSDIWVPTAVGFIKSGGSGLGREIKWKLRLHRGSFKEGVMLCAHDARGRGKGVDATEGRLSSLLQRYGVTAIAEGLMVALSDNLTGIRYGQQLLAASDVVGKSHMVSLFTEVRAGPLKGLRFYDDTAPKVTQTLASGEQTYFGWSAVNMGWALGMTLPQWLAPVANRFDLQPKVGMINLDTRLGGVDDWGMTQTEEFKLHAMVYGCEAGLERDFFKLALLRGWAGILYSSSSLGITKINFLSVRSGLDSYWDLTTIGPFKLKGLLFGSVETLSISKRFTAPADNSVVDRSAAITDVSYQLKFAGLGVTIAW